MSSFNSTSLHTELIIQASPERVRAVLLDFENLPKWKNRQNLILSLHMRRAGSDDIVTGIRAKVGDVAIVQSPQAGEARAEVFVNTPSRFGYRGAFAGYTAHHWWEFLSHGPDETSTLLRHCESYEGGVAALFWWPSPLRWYVTSLFDDFNRDLKDRAEEKVVVKG